MATQSEIARLIFRIQAQTQEMSSGLNEAKGKLSSFADTAKKILAGIGITLTAKKLLDLGKSAIDSADDLSKASQRYGVAIQTLSGLQYAAKLSGAEFADVGTSLKILSRNMFDFQRGVGDARDALLAMGLSVKDGNGNLKSLEVMIGEIADKFASYEDGAGKAALAQKLFGRSGETIIPLLNKGSAGIKALTDEAREFGTVLSEEAGRRAEEFNDNMTRLKEGLKGVTYQLADQLLPAMNGLLELLIKINALGNLLKATFAPLEWLFPPELNKGEMDELNKLFKKPEGPKKAQAPLFSKPDQTKVDAELETALQRIRKALLDIDQMYKDGRVTIEQYYIAQQSYAEAAANREIDALQAKLKLAETDEEKSKIRLEIQKIRNKYELEYIRLQQDEMEAWKKADQAQREMAAFFAGNKGGIAGTEEGKITAQYEAERVALENHYADMAEKIRSFSEEKIKIGEEYWTQQQALDEANRQKQLALDQLAAQKSRDIMMTKLQNTQEVLTGFGDILSTLYQQSGSQSKELFRLMQGVQFAEALINAYSAYNAAIGKMGPFGIPMANMVLTLGLAKAALILKTKPAGYALGGMVTGGSGGIDDVPIRATRGEFVMPTRSVQYYGPQMLEAMRNLTAPRAMPALAGAGGGGNSLSINVPVNVEQGNSLAGRLRAAIEETVLRVIEEKL